MPKPDFWHPPAGDSIITWVTAALREERQSIATSLEERHSAILAELSRQLLKGTLGASRGFPDVGPELSSRESTASATNGLPSANHRPLQSAFVWGGCRGESGDQKPSADSTKIVDRKDPQLHRSISFRERSSYVEAEPCEPMVDAPLKEASFVGEAEDRFTVASLASKVNSDAATGEYAMVGDNTGTLIQESSVAALPISMNSFGASSKVSALSAGGLSAGLTSVSSKTSSGKIAVVRAMGQGPRRKAGIWKGGERLTRDLVIRRLHAKLGYHAPDQSLKAEHLYAALEAMSLATFELCRVQELLRVLRVLAVDENGKVVKVTHSTGSTKSRRQTTTVSAPFGPAPSILRASEVLKPRTYSIPFALFVDVMLMEDFELVRAMGEDVQRQVVILRDTLLSSDANCLIAELMHLRVDDIAAPVVHISFLDYIEPVIGVVIILNAVLIGLQTVPAIGEHAGMIAAEIFFSLLFIFEFLAKIRHHGIVEHFFGHEKWWNAFDFLIILLALADMVISLTLDISDVNTSAMTIIRIARLTRLARLARIFRVSYLKELNLVCKGLVGGLRTLFWAVVLLFIILYVVAVLLTTTIGQSDDEEDSQAPSLKEYFSSLPRAWFTLFRCLLIVECSAESGKPILVLATIRYGWIVPIGYIFLFITVSIGLMNLIMALYIENTLREAKSTDESNKRIRERESLRVALLLKRLLLKICALQMGYHQSMTKEDIAKVLTRQGTDMILARESIDPNMEITKEAFITAIREPDVQQIMNELDIPPERAHLFDVLDADGSGELKPTELLNGLLKVRGEARRSDSTALLLAVRALQTQVGFLDHQILGMRDQIMRAIIGSAWSDGPRSHTSNFGSQAMQAMPSVDEG